MVCYCCFAHLFALWKLNWEINYQTTASKEATCLSTQTPHHILAGLFFTSSRTNFTEQRKNIYKLGNNHFNANIFKILGKTLSRRENYLKQKQICQTKCQQKTVLQLAAYAETTLNHEWY